MPRGYQQWRRHQHQNIFKKLILPADRVDGEYQPERREYYEQEKWQALAWSRLEKVPHECQTICHAAKRSLVALLAPFRECAQLISGTPSCALTLNAELSGADLIEQLRKLRQREIPAVVLSGDTIKVTPRCASITACRVFRKPVDAEELSAHLRKVLDSAAA